MRSSVFRKPTKSRRPMTIWIFYGDSHIRFLRVTYRLGGRSQVWTVVLVLPTGPRVVEPDGIACRIEWPVGLGNELPPVELERLVQLSADAHVLPGHVVRLTRIGQQIEKACLAGRTRRPGARTRPRRIAPHCWFVAHGQNVTYATGHAGHERKRVRQLGQRHASLAVKDGRCVVWRPWPGCAEVSVQRPVVRWTCGHKFIGKYDALQLGSVASWIPCMTR